MAARPRRVHTAPRPSLRPRAALQDLLAGCQRHEPDFQRNRGKYLEVQRDDGSTPLTLAAERGHFQIVELVRGSKIKNNQSRTP